MTTDTKTIALEVPKTKSKASKSLWQHAFHTITRDKLALTSLIIVGFYFLIALLTFLGVIAGDWGAEVGPSYAPPSAEYIFGTDIFGRSVFLKMVKGAESDRYKKHN
jgi:peptide/nickel transport system permease protein